jgi:hypothetical protein
VCCSAFASESARVDLVRRDPRRGAERAIAGDQRGVERLGESHVHGVVGGEVVAQLPCAAKEVDMRVAEDVEEDEILDRLFGAAREHLAGAHEAPERLNASTTITPTRARGG